MKQELLNEIVSEIEAEFKQLINYLFETEEPPTLEEIEVSFRRSMHRLGGHTTIARNVEVVLRRLTRS